MLFSGLANGQDYESIPIHPDYIFPDLPEDTSRLEKKEALDTVKGAISAGRNAVRANVKAGNANFGAEGDKYIRNYRLAEMTNTDPENLGQLGRQRTDFLNLILPKSAPTGYRRNVIQKFLPNIVAIANNKKFHPAVRVNAISMIGLMDDSVGGSSIPPTPSSAAYNALRQMFTANDSEIFVKVEAISGIRRFAELSRRGGQATLGSELRPQLVAIIDGFSSRTRAMVRRSGLLDEATCDSDSWIHRRRCFGFGHQSDASERFGH